MKTKLFAAAMIAVYVCGGSFAMNGRSATAVYLMQEPWTFPPNPGRLIVSTISGTSVTRTDTLLRGIRFFYPTWSPDGKRIAFFSNGGGGLSIIDADGKNRRTVATMADWRKNSGQGEELEQFITWSAIDGGKWIYYHRPCPGDTAVDCIMQGSGEIWKVNVDDTSQNIMICDYKKLNQCQLSRYSLSADAKYAICHVGGMADGAQLQQLGFTPVGVISHEFPPQVNPSTGWIDPNLTEPACAISDCRIHFGACNSALSASGNIIYHFYGGHCQLYASYWNHAAKTQSGFGTLKIGTGLDNSLDEYRDVEVWMKNDPRAGDVFIWPRGSNSDKIVNVLTGYRYTASYADAQGCNHLVINWKDKEAVSATNNPRGSSNGSAYWIAGPSDFRVDGGPDGCYQDTAGRWINEITGVIKQNANPAPASFVRAPSALSGTVAVYNLAGVRVGMADIGTPIPRVRAQIRLGAYIVAGNGVAEKAVVLGSGILSNKDVRKPTQGN
jgi:hypothetical protein